MSNAPAQPDDLLRKGEELSDKIKEQRAKLQQMPHMIRSFSRAHSVAHILDR